MCGRGRGEVGDVSMSKGHEEAFQDVGHILNLDLTGGYFGV